MRVVVAIHSREVKTGLFHALNGLDTVTIVATATSTAELESYCRSFRPDVIIVERGLPGRPLADTLNRLDECTGRKLVIDPEGAAEVTLDLTGSEAFEDVERLIAAIPEEAP